MPYRKVTREAYVRMSSVSHYFFFFAKSSLIYAKSSKAIDKNQKVLKIQKKLDHLATTSITRTSRRHVTILDTSSLEPVKLIVVELIVLDK
jgi:hypothetical protein